MKTISEVLARQYEVAAKLRKLIKIVDFHCLEDVEFDEGLDDRSMNDLVVCILTSVQESWDTYIQTHVPTEPYGAGEVNWNWETFEPNEETIRETSIKTVFTSNEQMLKIYYQNSD